LIDGGLPHAEIPIIKYSATIPLSACSSEEAPPSEEAEAKEQTVNAQPKENLNVLNDDKGWVMAE